MQPHIQFPGSIQDAASNDLVQNELTVFSHLWIIHCLGLRWRNGSVCWLSGGTGHCKIPNCSQKRRFFLWTGTTVLLISSAFVYNSYPRAIPDAGGSLSEIYMCMAPSGAITQLQRNSCLWVWRGSMKEGWAGRLGLCKARVVPEKWCSKAFRLIVAFFPLQYIHWE